MNCPKCGKENPDDAQLCRFCNSILTEISGATGNVDVRVSRLAVASLVLGFLSILSLPIASSRLGFLGVLFPPAGILAMILGIISIIRIEESGGRLTGTSFAIMGIVVPVFSLFVTYALTVLYRPRSVAFRIVCGSNLSGIGKAMLIYANDYEEKLPRAGGPNSRWTGHVPNWTADNRSDAYGLADGDGEVSITASFYLLVKYEEMTTKSFVCDKERGTSEFKPLEYGVTDKELIDVWDFGPNPSKHCSYSYHIPYGPYPLTTSCEPGMAVAADRNPWMDTPTLKAKDFSRFKWNGTIEQQKAGNTIVHQGDGQGVLFLDGSVRFEKRTYCGVNDDNIYTYWNGSQKQQGIPPKIGSQPSDRLDSLLVHDGAGKATKISERGSRR